MSNKRHPSNLADCAGSNDEIVDWAALAPLLIYPTKLLIIEALRWINRPMSAKELEKVFGKRFTLPTISYHITSLKEIGILRQVGKRQVRGATERFYFFTAAVSHACQS